MTPRDRRIVLGTILVVVGALLSTFVVASLWHANERLTEAEHEQDLTDENLQALAGAYEQAVSRDDDLPSLDEILESVELDIPAPIPGPPGRDGRDGQDGGDGRDGRNGEDGQDGRDAPNDPEPDDPEPNDLDPNDPDPDDPEVQDGEIQDPEVQDPEIDDPDPDDPAAACPDGYQLLPLQIGPDEALICLRVQP